MDPKNFNPLASPGSLAKVHEYVSRADGGRVVSVKVEGHAFVPQPLPPRLPDDVLGRLGMVLSEADRAMMRLEGLIASLPSPNLLLRPMQRREVKYSSQIEDTIATVQEAAVEGFRPGPTDSAPAEVDRNRRALEYGIASPMPMCLRLLREMHDVLMWGGRGNDRHAGKFREIPVRIGGASLAEARFVPPPPGEALMAALDAYERFLNPGSYPRQRYAPLIELACSHYQFETIHPFEDGNGRLGRLIIALSAFKSGELRVPLPYISRYLERHRQEYCDRLLAVSTQGDWEGWIRFFAQGVAEDCLDGIQRADRLIQIRREAIEKLSLARTSALVTKLIDGLFEYPLIDVVGAAELLGLTRPSAEVHIRRLEQIGFLREASKASWGRFWVADPILAVLED